MRSRLDVIVLVAAIFWGIAPETANGQIGAAIQMVMPRPRQKAVRRPSKPAPKTQPTAAKAARLKEVERRESEGMLDRMYEDARRSQHDGLASRPLTAPPAARPDKAKGTAWTWADASMVAASFGAAVKRMDEESGKFHQALAVDFSPPEFVGTAEEQLLQQVAFTRECRSRAQLMFVYHTKLHEAASRAAQIHPEAIEVYEWLADYYAAKARQAEFQETEGDFKTRADEYRRKAALLRATPVVLPAGYVKLGRLLQENVWFLGEVKKGLEIEASLALGTERTLARYTESFGAYREQFREWREQVLPGLAGVAGPGAITR